MATADWTTLRDWDNKPYEYIHKPSGIRLCDIKRRPVFAYDDSVGKWNVFVPGRTHLVNAGSGSAAEWKRWVETNADRLVADKDN